MALLSAGETVAAVGDGLSNTILTAKRFLSLSLHFWFYQRCVLESAVAVSVPPLQLSLRFLSDSSVVVFITWRSKAVGSHRSVFSSRLTSSCLSPMPWHIVFRNMHSIVDTSYLTTEVACLVVNIMFESNNSVQKLLWCFLFFLCWLVLKELCTTYFT